MADIRWPTLQKSFDGPQEDDTPPPKIFKVIIVDINYSYIIDPDGPTSKSVLIAHLADDSPFP
jgi:hypothetical protein